MNFRQRPKFSKPRSGWPGCLPVPITPYRPAFVDDYLRLMTGHRQARQLVRLASTGPFLLVSLLLPLNHVRKSRLEKRRHMPFLEDLIKAVQRWYSTRSKMCEVLGGVWVSSNQTCEERAVINVAGCSFDYNRLYIRCTCWK